MADIGTDYKSQSVCNMQSDDNSVYDYEKCKYCLAFQCAPVLSGIKPSNLLIIKGSICEKLMTEIEKAEANYYLLYADTDRHIYLVYRYSMMRRLLQKSSVVRFLLGNGYDMADECDLEAILSRLSGRLSTAIAERNEFPHEIGILMGYPVEDVLGFVEHKGRNYELSGYWKVYHRRDVAAGLFRQYDLARRAAVRHISYGGALSGLRGAYITEYRADLLRASKASKNNCSNY